jgi:hypothetical protein
MASQMDMDIRNLSMVMNILDIFIEGKSKVWVSLQS